MLKKVLVFLLLPCTLLSCAKKYLQFTGQYTFHSPDGKPNYADLDYWAAHPGKMDPSDSVPEQLGRNYRPDSMADVFFIHPTSYADARYSLGYNAPVDDPVINAKTDYGSILYQASVFNAAGKIYAPRYRQANYWCYFPKDTAAAVAAFDLAYQDVKTAFEYYLAHYNHGRPIIIASHSQGTNHAIRLLKEFFDGRPLQKQLVAAYLAGMPVRKDEYHSIPACTTPDQTGCICSWRTMQTGYLTDVAKSETFKAVVTNPLTWLAAAPFATRKENPGSVLQKFKKIKVHIVNAEVHGNVLWANKPKFFGNFLIRFKNYHVGDFNFFYLSIRENAKLRASAFGRTGQ